MTFGTKPLFQIVAMSWPMECMKLVGVTAMFIFRRPIAGPLVALALSAVLVVVAALFDVRSTPGTNASDISSSDNTTTPAPLESNAQRLAAVAVVPN
jgi:hypothetical protein